MLDTGTTIFSLLNFPAVLLPLIAALVLFIRGAYKKDSATLLLLLSCLLLTRAALAIFLPVNPELASSIFDTAELLLIGSLYRSALANPQLKYRVNYILIAYASIAATLLASSPAFNYHFFLSITHSVLLVLLSLYALYQLISKRFVFLFQEPLFWIAGGTWFYFSMIIIAEWLQRHHYLSGDGNEKLILLSIFNTLRLSMYLTAALLRDNQDVDDEWKNLKESSREYLS